jgi:hypothetical protein
MSAFRREHIAAGRPNQATVIVTKKGDGRLGEGDNLRGDWANLGEGQFISGRPGDWALGDFGRSGDSSLGERAMFHWATVGEGRLGECGRSFAGDHSWATIPGRLGDFGRWAFSNLSSKPSSMMVGGESSSSECGRLGDGDALLASVFGSCLLC